MVNAERKIQSQNFLREYWISPPEKPEIARTEVEKFHSLVRQLTKRTSGPNNRNDRYQRLEDKIFDPALKSQLSHLLEGREPAEFRFFTYGDTSIFQVTTRSRTVTASIELQGVPYSNNPEWGFIAKLSIIDRTTTLFSPNKTLINLISQTNSVLEKLIESRWKSNEM